MPAEGMRRVWLCIAALGTGCLDQYQRHSPSRDAAVRDAAAQGDAPARDAAARLSGVELTLRDAFDGRGVELGPSILLEDEAGAFEDAQGVRPFEMINGQLVHVGSGVRPDGARAVPVLRFTPNRDGTVSARSLRWLSLGPPGYRPGESTASNNNTTMVVCTRDQGDALRDERASVCGLVWSDRELAFASQITLGAVAQVALIRSPISYNRFATLSVRGAPSPVLTVRQWEMDLSFETFPPIERPLPCPSSTLLATGRLPDAWVVSRCQGVATDASARRTLRVAAANLLTQRDTFAPYAIDFGDGLLAPEAGAAPPIADAAALGPDQEDGAALLVNRHADDPSRSARDVLLVRLYRSGAWAAQRIAEGTEARWMQRRPGGGWLIGMRRSAPDSSERVSELLRIDANGRRLAPPLAYSRGPLARDVGYGLEPSECGLWILDVAGSRPRLRRIDLCPVPR